MTIFSLFSLKTFINDHPVSNGNRDHPTPMEMIEHRTTPNIVMQDGESSSCLLYMFIFSLPSFQTFTLKELTITRIDNIPTNIGRH
jgi:hypothetical protein